MSTATVSRALRGVGRVSEATRASVLKAAAELGYVPSPTAASLASGKTGVVAVLVPFLSRWFFAQALDAIEHTLRLHGLHVLLVNVGEEVTGRTVLLDRRVLRGRTDGLLVLSCDLARPEVAVLSGLHLPVVSIGVELPPWDRVGIDDAGTAEEAMNHLLALGHRRLAYVGGNTETDINIATALDRRAGARRALDRAGPRDGQCLELVGGWTIAGGIEAGEHLLGLPSPPTGVLAASDEMAVGVMYAARLRGVRIPQDLSVIGIDGHDFALPHDLTTVEQPVRQLGATAAGLLVSRLLDPAGRTARRTVTLPTRLVVRGSTAVPHS